MKTTSLTVALAAIAALSIGAAQSVRADQVINYDTPNFGQNGAGDESSNAGLDSSYPYVGQQGFVLNGEIRRVDIDHDRIVVFSDSGQRYNVDDYDADIRSGGADVDTTNLQNGMQVQISGRLLGRTFMEADNIRIQGSGTVAQTSPADMDQALPTPREDVVTPDTDALPMVAAPESAEVEEQQQPIGPPIAPSPAAGGVPVTMDAVVTGVESDGRHIDLLDENDHALVADTLGSDILLPGVNREGLLTDITRGMHVHLIGTQASDGSVQADRIRVVADPAPPAAQEATPVAPVVPNLPVDVDLTQYTGVLIDVSGFGDIQRSPAPTLVTPDGALLYPDRSDVPTPDEVQSESIVRYYHSLTDAEQGVCGAHPLILTAVSVVGPASDGVELSASDAALFQALDARLRYTHTWKVGFLIPENR